MVMLVGTAVSYLTGPLKPNEVDPKLIISMSDMFCCCLPDRWRRLPQYNADKVVYLAVKVWYQLFLSRSAVIVYGSVEKR